MKAYRFASAILALLLVGIALSGQEITGKHRKVFSTGGTGPQVGVHAVASTQNSVVNTAGVSTQATGSSFYVCVVYPSTFTPTISDHYSNVYSQSGTNTTFLSAYILARYKSVNGSGGTGHTFTLSTTGSGILSIWAVEIKNSTGGVDQQNAQVTSSSPFDSPSVTTGTANEVLIGCAMDNSTAAGDNFTAGQSFSLLDQLTNGASQVTGASAGRAVSSTGAYKSEFTSVQGTSMAVSIDTFK